MSPNGHLTRMIHLWYKPPAIGGEHGNRDPVAAHSQRPTAATLLPDVWRKGRRALRRRPWAMEGLLRDDQPQGALARNCPRCSEPWTEHGGIEEPVCRDPREFGAPSQEMSGQDGATDAR